MCQKRLRIREIYKTRLKKHKQFLCKKKCYDEDCMNECFFLKKKIKENYKKLIEKAPQIRMNMSNISNRILINYFVVYFIKKQSLYVF